PENGAAGVVLHLDANFIAETQVRRFGRAALDRFHYALLGDAGVTNSAGGNRLARAAVRAVRDRARTDDGACAKRPGASRVDNQRREIKRHVDAGVGAAERLAVEVDQYGQADLS